MKKDSKIYKRRTKGLVVITGCDSGIGKSLADLLLLKGYPVLLSYLEAPVYENRPHLYEKKMDLRISEEVDAFCSYINELCRGGMRLEAVICNAGVALGGPIENIPFSYYKESFDINFFGVVRVIQASIPELIRSKGKIIINGSIVGKVAVPFLSPYVSTKYALEGFCDSLRREMKPYGIKTVLLEPVIVATPIWNKAKNQDISFVDRKYLKSLRRFQKIVIDRGKDGLKTEFAAVTIANILLQENPKARYIIEKGKMCSKILRTTPCCVLDCALTMLFQMDYGKNKTGKKMI